MARVYSMNVSGPCRYVPRVSLVYTGEWMDSSFDDLPDAGEEIVYTIVVTNEGTLTLNNVEATSTSGIVTCDDVAQPVPVFAVGASFECTASHLVRVARLRAACPQHFSLERLNIT